MYLQVICSRALHFGAFDTAFSANLRSGCIAFVFYALQDSLEAEAEAEGHEHAAAGGRQ